MPVHALKTVLKLEGHADAEAAETVLAWLREHPRGVVDLSRCDGLHTALLQTLLALRPTLRGQPREPGLAALLGPHQEIS